MTVHIDELTTDVAVEGADHSAGQHAGGWDAEADQRVAARRAAEIRERTHSEAFDD